MRQLNQCYRDIHSTKCLRYERGKVSTHLCSHLKNLEREEKNKLKTRKPKEMKRAETNKFENKYGENQ